MQDVQMTKGALFGALCPFVTRCSDPGSRGLPAAASPTKACEADAKQCDRHGFRRFDTHAERKTIGDRSLASANVIILGGNPDPIRA